MLEDLRSQAVMDADGQPVNRLFTVGGSQQQNRQQEERFCSRGVEGRLMEQGIRHVEAREEQIQVVLHGG